MATEWFYFKGDERSGPVSPQQLKSLAATGVVLPTDLIWKEGMPQSVAAAKLKGLFEASVPAAQALPVARAIPVAMAPPPLPKKAESSTDHQSKNGDGTEDVAPDRTKGNSKKKRYFIIGIVAGGLFLFSISCCGIVGLFGYKPLNVSIFGGKSGSYTQRILDLDATKRKEFGLDIPAETKPLFEPESVGDFLQSLAICKSGNGIQCYDTHSSGINWGETDELNGVKYSYKVYFVGGVFMKKKCWDSIYGPQSNLQSVNESTGKDKRFGGGGVMVMNRWTVPCNGETVLVRGLSAKAIQAAHIKDDELVIDYIHFNKTYESICPQPGWGGQRPLSLK